MTTGTFTEEEQEVWQIVTAMNRAWVTGSPELVAGFLHDHATILGPGLTVMAEGKTACAQSYRDFVGRAHIQHFAEHSPFVRVSFPTAVAAYRYDIRYTMEGVGYEEKGQDLLVCVHEDGRWQVFCREVLFDEKR
jgi:Domain of unknown function (DUF4440)